MITKETFLHWLTTVFKQPANQFSELFYFDKRDNQFFSILVTDYFLFDDELNLAKDVTSTYSKKSLESLRDRVKRIESNDSNILPIPRLGELEEQEIQKQLSLFLRANNIDVETATIWEIDGKGTATIDIRD